MPPRDFDRELESHIIMQTSNFEISDTSLWDGADLRKDADHRVISITGMGSDDVIDEAAAADELAKATKFAAVKKKIAADQAAYTKFKFSSRDDERHKQIQAAFHHKAQAAIGHVITTGAMENCHKIIHCKDYSIVHGAINLAPGLRFTQQQQKQQ
jgi:hypothetical protein